MLRFVPAPFQLGVSPEPVTPLSSTELIALYSLVGLFVVLTVAVCVWVIKT